MKRVEPERLGNESDSNKAKKKINNVSSRKIQIFRLRFLRFPLYILLPREMRNK